MLGHTITSGKHTVLCSRFGNKIHLGASQFSNTVVGFKSLYFNQISTILSKVLSNKNILLDSVQCSFSPYSSLTVEGSIPAWPRTFLCLDCVRLVILPSSECGTRISSECIYSWFTQVICPLKLTLMSESCVILQPTRPKWYIDVFQMLIFLNCRWL